MAIFNSYVSLPEGISSYLSEYVCHFCRRNSGPLSDLNSERESCCSPNINVFVRGSPANAYFFCNMERRLYRLVRLTKLGACSLVASLSTWLITTTYSISPKFLLTCELLENLISGHETCWNMVFRLARKSQKNTSCLVHCAPEPKAGDSHRPIHPIRNSPTSTLLWLGGVILRLMSSNVLYFRWFSGSNC